ncbi:hypothetical protein E0H73_44275 [Kribbella pittospori]|uniref:LppX_LprAFG lipoprotein n=1 Tax=Kribbella pittospori TaxID=722689 RepID=A0A4R0JGN3_9ACTN|nr:hypothetical protein [Kribbella pittospori]TCC46143.1 hypothetical protein E0H73_44275 [Kribbella pittospori]
MATALIACDPVGTSGTPSVTPSTTASAPTSSRTPSTTPAPPDLSTLPAATLLARAKAAASAASGLRVKGLLVDDTGDLRIDLQLTKSGGQGAFLVAGTPITYRVIGKDVYMLLSEATIRAMAKDEKAGDAEIRAMLSLMKNKWIKPSKIDKDGQALIDLTTRDTFFKGFFGDVGHPTKTGKKVVDGVTSVGLTGQGATLWVDTRTARPVRFENNAGRDYLTFTNYGKVAAPKAPKPDQILDGKAFGF